MSSNNDAVYAQADKAYDCAADLWFALKNSPELQQSHDEEMEELKMLAAAVILSLEAILSKYDGGRAE